MRYTLVRIIAFHSPGFGLTSKYVAKDVESEVPPQVGYEFEDSAWHRNDPIKAESISIDAQTGKCTVHLNPKQVEAASDVERFYDIAVQYHGWRNWLGS